MSNPAIRPQPNGDVDIAIPAEKAVELANGSPDPNPEPSVDPDNSDMAETRARLASSPDRDLRYDHPEELMGE
jgi:hypothetical protein